jgi:2-keto-4-pentenoate hydratase
VDVKERQAAADLLWSCWTRGTLLESDLPDELRPKTRAEGYAIQATLERRTTAPLYGWKIAATSTAGQQHIKVDGPLAGRILRERVYAPGAAVPFDPNFMRVAEPEFGFRMAADLAPRAAPYTVEDVTRAVASLHPTIELPDSRFRHFERAGTAQLLADNACAHYLVVGDAAPDSWRKIDLAAHPVTGIVTGKITRTGTGAAALGGPLIALTWLVNELSGIGVALKAGQVVTTGTCVAPLAIERGDEVVHDMGPFGRIAVRLT